MPITQCPCCRQDVTWEWEEAFSKHGFYDGKGTIETATVIDALEEAEYEVATYDFNFRNIVIAVIRKNGKDLIPGDTLIGRHNPRDYLPDEIVELLDLKFPR
jgi:hypothetical protein